MLKKIILRFSDFIAGLQLYLWRTVESKNDLRFVDLGASALVCPPAARAFRDLKIYAFDPDPRAESSVEVSGASLEFFPFAIASTNEVRSLYLTAKTHCSSLCEPLRIGDPRYEVVDKVEVQCRSLDSCQLSVDAIKVDVQGAELEVLKGASDTLAHVTVVQLEGWFQRRYRGQARIDELVEYMDSAGFKFAGFTTLYSNDQTAQSGLGFADLLFVRPVTNGGKAKVLAAFLCAASLDSMIPRFLASSNLSLSEKLVCYAVVALSALKMSGPRYL